jgi:hypothetical protein
LLGLDGQEFKAVKHVRIVCNAEVNSPRRNSSTRSTAPNRISTPSWRNATVSFGACFVAP